MISSAQLLDGLSQIGITRFTGVPCSYFSGPIELASASPEFEYDPAANEGTAISAAAGAYLAGSETAIFMQNSGFGNIINPLTSLVLPYAIPVLVFVSMRGWPSASAGEPQHHWMGKVLPDWLDSLDVAHEVLSPDLAELQPTLERGRRALNAGRPFFVLVGKNVVEGLPAGDDSDPAREGVARSALVAAVVEAVEDTTPVLSTTGHMSRELFASGDRPANFYMQGSMGHLAAISLGVAKHTPARKIVVLDGDGAVLMHAGALANLAGAQTGNVIHVVYDNGIYASTGGQAVKSGVDFRALGESVGYGASSLAGTDEEFRMLLSSAMNGDTNALIVVAGRQESVGAGGRASESLSVDALAERFRRTLAEASLEAGGVSNA